MKRETKLSEFKRHWIPGRTSYKSLAIHIDELLKRLMAEIFIMQMPGFHLMESVMSFLQTGRKLKLPLQMRRVGTLLSLAFSPVTEKQLSTPTLKNITMCRMPMTI